MSTSSSGAKLDLPDGVSLGPGRETSETNAQGVVVQGLKFPITTKNGTTSTVFIPYSELHNTDAVKAIIDRRVNAIVAIAG